MRKVGKFVRGRAGNVALLAAIMIPALTAGVGAALDYINMSRYHVLLQKSADAAAVASARQLNFMDGLNPPQRKAALAELAQQMVDIQLLPTQRPAEAKIKLLPKDRVEIVATHIMQPVFNGLPGFKPFPVSARAVAQALQGQNVCVLATETKSEAAIRLQNDARLTGPTCGVYSNSLDSDGVVAENSAIVEASLVCSAGGTKGGSHHFDAAVVTDCPQLEDPLAHRTPPPMMQHLPCKAVPVLGYRSGSVMLEGGRYCGDVIIGGVADVYLSPGDYWFEGGRLLVEDEARLTGRDVALYFHDAAAHFDFRDLAEVELSGRVVDTMAGMLVFANPTGSKRAFSITSPNVSKLVGTVYMPADQLAIDAPAPVGNSSAFTVIVARELHMRGAPNLVLNTDYSLTDVPVPEGVTNVGARARLVR